MPSMRRFGSCYGSGPARTPARSAPAQRPEADLSGRRNVSCLQFPASQKTQNVSFNPSCITRLLPEPTSGLPAATSGVAPPLPNAPGPEGSQPNCAPFAEPYGLAIIG